MSSQSTVKLVFLLIGSTLTLAAVAESVSFEGDVYSLSGGEHLYSESHIVDSQSLQTRYTSPSGDEIAQRQLRFDNGRVSEYTLQQPRSNSSESVQRLDDVIRITTSTDGTREISPPNINDVVIDAGFTNFILRNWDTLSGGEKIRAEVLSVSRGEVIKLQLHKIDPAKTAMAKHGNIDGVTAFRMKIANPLLRFLVDPIDVAYYNDTRQMAFYQGLSNLTDANGEQIEKIWVLFTPQISSPMPIAE